MSDPITDSFTPQTSASSAGNGGFATQAIRYERVLGWVLWSGLLAVLVLASL
jgi:hypothetical protein